MVFNKRFTALAMAGVIGVGAFSTAFSSFSPVFGAWNKVNGTYQMIDGSSIDGVYARGIDVSHWKQNIDWSAVAQDDVQFVMLGTRYNGDVDPYFRINADGAHANGIKLGAYIYSYATSEEMAIAEADFVLNLIKDYPISYPVAFDAEANVLGDLGPARVSSIINAFCKRIEDAGYYPMVYANDNWLANKIDMSQVHYDVWVARYQVKHSYQNPAMWQATSTGSISGVQGNVDIDFQYKDFSGLIPANRWRTIGENTYYYQDFAMQRSSWIDDGSGWFYMNENGNPSKGWFTDASGTFYLDDSTGRMTLGWKQQDDKWYYFSQDNGHMATGWVQDGDSRYFMNSDGTMATGWISDNNMRYYLADSGAMQTGWQMLDDSWYYFNTDGNMASGWVNPDGSWYYLDNSGKMQSGWFSDDSGRYFLSTSSGKMTVGWREIDGGWYFFNDSGNMLTGLNNIGEVEYYLDPSTGRMLTDTTVTVGDNNYSIGSDGACSLIVPEEAADGGNETPSAEGAEPSVDAPAANENNSSGGGVLQGPGF